MSDVIKKSRKGGLRLWFCIQELDVLLQRWLADAIVVLGILPYTLIRREAMCDSFKEDNHNDLERFRRVAVQFPDALLADATEVLQGAA